VVPLAVALDWMSRLADAGDTVALRDIDVMRAIAAPAVVTVRRSGSELGIATSAAGLCYRARLAAPAETARWPAGAELLEEPNGLGPSCRDPLYDGETLFHGPSLQVLRRVEGVGPDGAVGEVAGAAEMGWPDEPWRIDPGAVDGAIQLAVVWAHEQTGRSMLPMALREARIRAVGLERGPLHCVVRAVSVGEHGAVCDVLLLTGRHDGALVAALNGLELVARPR
jgi:hypothetical protein